MFIINSILLLLIGLAVGSFLNVLIFRMDDLRTVLYERSHCPQCRKTLAWYDLIPFISFVMLRAKCRYCGKGISWQYPLVELSTALVFLFMFLALGISWGLVFYLAIFSILMVVLVYDIKTQTVPEIFVWLALVISFLGGWYFGGFGLLNMLYGGLIVGAFLGSLVFFSKEKWMGAGDIKIGLILGFLTGFPAAIITLFIAFFLGSVVGLAYIYYQNKKIDRVLLKQSLPFAPFLITATIIGVVYGSVITNWYLSWVKY